MIWQISFAHFTIGKFSSIRPTVTRHPQKGWLELHQIWGERIDLTGFTPQPFTSMLMMLLRFERRASWVETGIRISHNDEELSKTGFKRKQNLTIFRASEVP